MKKTSTHARLLLAFRDGEILTKREVFERAKTEDQNLLRLLVQADFIEPNAPGHYRITGVGLERQKLYEPR